MFDKGKEFLGEFAAMVSNDYGIERKGITVGNPPSSLCYY
jgi:hypothetical protein